MLQYWGTLPEPELGYFLKVIPLSDGYITFGLTVVEVIMGTKLVQPTLAKLDTNFETQWIRHFGKVVSLGGNVTFWDMHLDQEGNIVGAGENLLPDANDYNRRTGWVVKFSPEGDSLWSRLDHSPFPPYFLNDNFLCGMGFLSSGNIVAGGGCTEGNKFYVWLVKMTPDGCIDTLFCNAVGVDDEPFKSRSD